jgi:hypothetical protein
MEVLLSSLPHDLIPNNEHEMARTYMYGCTRLLIWSVDARQIGDSGPVVQPLESLGRGWPDAPTHRLRKALAFGIMRSASLKYMYDVCFLDAGNGCFHLCTIWTWSAWG